MNDVIPKYGINKNHRYWAATRFGILMTAPDKDGLKKRLEEFHLENPGEQAYIFTRDMLPTNYPFKEQLDVPKKRKSRESGGAPSKKARVRAPRGKKSGNRGRN